MIGEGRVDHSTVFADCFHNILDGIGRRRTGKPREYLLYVHSPFVAAERMKMGKAKPLFDDRCRTVMACISTYVGHDLHGLIIGPDGKLYFSLGRSGLQY